MALTPGERLDLKKKIAETLGQQGWREIDLTLHEFGLSTTEEGNFSTTTDYVLEMLRYGTADESLAQLDDYLHPTSPPAAFQSLAFDDPSDPGQAKASAYS